MPLSQDFRIKIKDLLPASIMRFYRFVRYTVLERECCTKYITEDFYYPSYSGIGQHIKQGKEWDTVFRIVLPHIFISPSIVIEVGANIGASTRVIADLFKQTKFVLVEPATRFRRYLKKNVHSISERVIAIENRIIGNVTGQTRLLITNFTSGTASNADYGPGHRTSEYPSTITLDDLTNQLCLTSVDFLKVDTDGFEFEVISGGGQVLTTFKPLIFVEFSPTDLNRLRPAEEFINLLECMDCEIFLVFSPSGQFLGIGNCYDEIMSLKDKHYYVDLFTVPKGSRYEESLFLLGQRLTSEITDKQSL